jgi:DNA-binding NarL/FixJ family response regulator
VAEFHRRLASLSGAQLRVLTALSDGKLNKQIAGDMNLTEGTVKQHVSAILKKLAVTNRSQAIVAARPYLQDLVSKDEPRRDETAA